MSLRVFRALSRSNPALVLPASKPVGRIRMDVVKCKSSLMVVFPRSENGQCTSGGVFAILQVASQCPYLLRGRIQIPASPIFISSAAHQTNDYRPIGMPVQTRNQKIRPDMSKSSTPFLRRINADARCGQKLPRSCGVTKSSRKLCTFCMNDLTAPHLFCKCGFCLAAVARQRLAQNIHKAHCRTKNAEKIAFVVVVSGGDVQPDKRFREHRSKQIALREFSGIISASFRAQINRTGIVARDFFNRMPAVKRSRRCGGNYFTLLKSQHLPDDMKRFSVGIYRANKLSSCGVLSTEKAPGFARIGATVAGFDPVRNRILDPCQMM